MAKYQGYLAEFESADLLIDAAKRVADLNYRLVEFYTPFPIEELEDIFSTKNSVAAVAFCGGLSGGLIGLGMQVYSTAYDYPILVGGKPYLSWPAFIPVTFELAVLFASISVVAAFLLGNRLPRLNFPLFDIAGFERATRDRFFLCISEKDPHFNPVDTPKHLQSLSPSSLEKIDGEL